MDLKQTFQNLLNMDETKRVEEGRKIVKDIREKLTPKYKSEDIEKIILLVFSCGAAADLKINRSEHKFYVKVTDSKMSYDEFFEIAQYGTEFKFIERVSNVVRELESINDEAKTEIILLLACVCAVNRKITADEQEFIEKMLF